MAIEKEIHYPQDEVRPMLISLICILDFIYVVIGLLMLIFHPPLVKTLAHLHGVSFPLVTFVLSLGTLIALYGVWEMRYWGPLLFTIIYVLGGLYTYMIGAELLTAYIPGFLFIIICLIYIREMH